jgi:hypothetical protein
MPRAINMESWLAISTEKWVVEVSLRTLPEFEVLAATKEILTHHVS